MIHGCRLVRSLIQEVVQRIFSKQESGSLQPLFLWTARAGESVTVERSPAPAAHCLSMLSPCSCPLVSDFVAMPHFPQSCRYFTMAFPFVSLPHSKGEFSSLFIHSLEVMFYLFLQGCVMPFRFSPQTELFLEFFRGSF